MRAVSACSSASTWSNTETVDVRLPSNGGLADSSGDSSLFGSDLFQAYAGELNQVWTNIIDNAIDAMAQSSGERILMIGSRQAEKRVEISIADTGAGIPEEIRGDIFDPFMTTKEPGEGVGLE